MLFRSLMKLAAVAVILALSVVPAVQAAGKQSVVIQMSDNDPAKWNLALNNAKNVQQELGKDKVDIEIVAYGPGINMLKFDSEVANRVTDAAKDGVAIRACGNTMKAMKLSEKDLNSVAKVVPAGVIEIMTKQHAGWAYIKP
jgi:intracellular sulfur oxidation DsrE/DsrF family protein